MEEEIWAAKTDVALKEYWEWPQGNVRSKWFAKKLKDFEFQSIYEVGVFGGRNLHHIHKAFPNVIVGGLDINEGGIQQAKEKLPGGQFDLCSAFDIDKIDGQWDVIFTMGVAIHLAPDIFGEFIEKTIKKANKYIIHIEQSGSGTILNGPIETNPSQKITNKIRWAPNFAQEYANFGLSADITALPKNIKSNDCSNLIIVNVGGK